MHATCHIKYYVNNIWWRITHIQLTTQSSAPLCSYLPCTPNNHLTTLPSQTLSHCFFFWHNTPNSTPTQNDRNNVSFIYLYMQHSELNECKYCLIMYCLFFPQDQGPSKILSGFNISWTRLTAVLHNQCDITIQTVWHFTVMTAHNPFLTAHLFH